jgi:hypothetical protein
MENKMLNIRRSIIKLKSKSKHCQFDLTIDA